MPGVGPDWFPQRSGCADLVRRCLGKGAKDAPTAAFPLLARSVLVPGATQADIPDSSVINTMPRFSRPGACRDGRLVRLHYERRHRKSGGSHPVSKGVSKNPGRLRKEEGP
ncbi:hypothetical protein GCM10018965_072370 [Nonomuraea roseola]